MRRSPCRSASTRPPVVLWINEWLTGKVSLRSGAIVRGDVDRKQAHRLEFVDAQITSLDVGTFDSAAKDSMHFTITVQPAHSSTSTGPFPTLAKGSTKHTALRSNFRLHLGTLPTDHVSPVTAPTAESSVPRLSFLQWHPRTAPCYVPQLATS
jgi:hypothetical protein